MRRTIRNKLVHDHQTAQAVEQASHARRQAYNELSLTLRYPT